MPPSSASPALLMPRGSGPPKIRPFSNAAFFAHGDPAGARAAGSGQRQHQGPTIGQLQPDPRVLQMLFGLREEGDHPGEVADVDACGLDRPRADPGCQRIDPEPLLVAELALALELVEQREGEVLVLRRQLGQLLLQECRRWWIAADRVAVHGRHPWLVENGGPFILQEKAADGQIVNAINDLVCLQPVMARPAKASRLRER